MLIKNGFLIDPASDTERLVDLRITDGLIQTLADAGTLTPENGEDELDAAGLMISPGLVDTHIHFRDPGFTYKEDLHTGSLAAAAGGFTSVICMANTSPVIDSVPVLKELMEREALEDIHIFQAAAVSCGLKGEEMTSMKELAAAGACGFTDDGIPLKNAAFLYKAMEEAKALDLPIVFMKKILHLLKQTESTTDLYLMRWASTDLLRLLKNLLLPEIVCWRFVPVHRS